LRSISIYHIGTAAHGALFVPFCRTFRFSIRYISTQLKFGSDPRDYAADTVKQNNNYVQSVTDKTVQFIDFVERFIYVFLILIIFKLFCRNMTMIDKQAYVYTALFALNFSSATSKSFDLLENNVENKIGDFDIVANYILLVGKVKILIYIHTYYIYKYICFCLFFYFSSYLLRWCQLFSALMVCLNHLKFVT
jgi:hypothetical protein